MQRSKRSLGMQIARHTYSPNGLRKSADPPMRCSSFVRDCFRSDTAIRPRTTGTLPGWRRPVLRREVLNRSAARLQAARLLDVIGELQDVPILPRVAREPKRSGQDRLLGRALARRLAAVATVRDLGRVSIEVDGSVIAGGDIRRKVL